MANTDISPCTSLQAVLEYLVKYCARAEGSSRSYRDVVGVLDASGAWLCRGGYVIDLTSRPRSCRRSIVRLEKMWCGGRFPTATK